MKTTIILNNVKWAPYSKFGYATDRIQTIYFSNKDLCDEWVKDANNEYEGCIQYVSLPFLTGNDILTAQITNE